MSPSVAASVTGLDRFQTLWQRCLLAEAPDHSATIHSHLLEAYAEPQRYYHTLEHIEHCLGQFDACYDLLTRPDAVELAVWFHDVIYQPGKRDNEARSAELYMRLSEGVQAQDLRELVEHLIMATLHNGERVDSDDARYMVDIDLSSFGLDWDGFLRDSQNLRSENPHVSDDVFYRNQTEFQACLLAKERFFLSDYFYQRLETRARENLARYFKLIGKTA